MSQFTDLTGLSISASAVETGAYSYGGGQEISLTKDAGRIYPLGNRIRLFATSGAQVLSIPEYYADFYFRVNFSGYVNDQGANNWIFGIAIRSDNGTTTGGPIIAIYVAGNPNLLVNFYDNWESLLSIYHNFNINDSFPFPLSANEIIALSSELGNVHIQLIAGLFSGTGNPDISEVANGINVSWELTELQTPNPVVGPDPPLPDPSDTPPTPPTLPAPSVSYTGVSGVSVNSSAIQGLSVNVSGIYTLIPGQTFDRFYLDTSVDDTVTDVRIPDPMIQTALVGR